jgi:predicted acetyltransferase
MTNLEIIPAARGQMPILANLFELYAHDFSEFLDLDLGPDGRFGYQGLPLYWTDPARHALLARVDGKLAGFALVKHGSEVSGDQSVWDMVEFFVVRRYRRLGIGTEVAHQVWRMFPGRWEVRVMEANRAALPFWERAIAAFTGAPAGAMQIEKGGKRWHVFSFESQRGALT